MYENPISGMLGEIQTKIIEQRENRVIQAVQNCGISVDKEELIKALMYDRQQYEKGYADAKAEQQWIPCDERLPECEQEVLICTEKKLFGQDAYIDSVVTPALYEDGTMSEIDSKWRWEDIDFEEWDDVEDCGIIPEGWWENRHFNPDDVYNNVVDRKVVAWMPLPEPYKDGSILKAEASTKEDRNEQA